jgi:hypothetical protein
MSFLKITDPAKRDLLVQELIKTRKNILQDSIDERVGEITAQQSLSKLFKPLTEKIETTTKAIKEMPTSAAGLSCNTGSTTAGRVGTAAAQAPALAQALAREAPASRLQQAVNSRPNLAR